jgi:hypothetical protein
MLCTSTRCEEGDSVVRKKWADLPARTRHVLLVAGAVEAGLRVAALVDLARRPENLVPGSKKLWALALVLLNSAGIVPVAYFVASRRRR